MRHRPLPRLLLSLLILMPALTGCGESENRPSPLSGIAVDCATNRPLTGVVVLMETLNSSTSSRGFLRRTFTNANGQFLLPGATGYSYRIEATYPGYHPAIVQTEPRNNIQLRLLRGASKDPTYGCQTAGACRPVTAKPGQSEHLPPCPEQ